MDKTLYVAVCENLKHEAQALQNTEGFIPFELICFPARCARPQVNQDELEELLASCDLSSEIHIFGSCCIAHLKKASKRFAHCTLHHHDQCFYMINNKSYIDDLLQKGAYLTSPGWLSRWQNNTESWGFDREGAKNFFKESAKSIYLLDTQVSPDTASQAQEFAEYAGLPLESIPTGLDFFKLLVHKALTESLIRKAQSECTALKKRASDCMMTLDILAGLSTLTQKKDVIDSVMELFSVLFAPKEIKFFPLSKNKPESSAFLKQLHVDTPLFWENINKNGFAWIEPDNDGFWLLIKSEDLFIGIIKVHHITFPEYSKFYLNLAIPIAKMCGLLVSSTVTIKELKRAHKMEALGTVAGGIAHDFNNILSVIIGFSGMAKDEIPESSPARKMVDKVLKASNLAKGVVKHFMMVSDHDTKNPEPVLVASLVEKALNILRDTIPPTIALEEVINSESSTILADPLQINQIVMNLCVNAVHAIGEQNGALEVSLNDVELSGKDLKLFSRSTENQPGTYVELIIKDTGPGVSEAVLDKIFDPYFTTKGYGSAKGTGMGLAVVHGIIEKHNGFVTVESEVGVGTSFFVYFPVIENGNGLT